MAKLEDFLAELAINPQKLGEFIHDPEAAMHDAGLSSEDQAALRSGFPNIVYARLAGVPIQQAFQLTSSLSTGASQNIGSPQIAPYYQININLSPTHHPFFITMPEPPPPPEPEPKPPEPKPPN
jgi:hypothetical protein